MQRSLAPGASRRSHGTSGGPAGTDGAPGDSAYQTRLDLGNFAGYNLEAIRSFLAKKGAEHTAAPPKQTRKKRRKGTWADVIGSDPPESGRGRAPPAG